MDGRTGGKISATIGGKTKGSTGRKTSEGIGRAIRRAAGSPPMSRQSREARSRTTAQRRQRPFSILHGGEPAGRNPRSAETGCITRRSKTIPSWKEGNSPSPLSQRWNGTASSATRAEDSNMSRSCHGMKFSRYGRSTARCREEADGLVSPCHSRARVASVTQHCLISDGIWFGVWVTTVSFTLIVFCLSPLPKQSHARLPWWLSLGWYIRWFWRRLTREGSFKRKDGYILDVGPRAPQSRYACDTKCHYYCTSRWNQGSTADHRNMTFR